MSDEDDFAFDDAHPIPDLGVVDIHAPRKTGGADLVIVIASPLANDERSLQRLLKKIELYLAFLRTVDFRSESGEPSPQNTRIVVNIHRDSSDEAFELLRRCAAWCEDNNASLVVEHASVRPT